MAYSIRAVSEADAAAIVALLNPIILAGGQTVMDEPVSLDNQIDFIRAFPKRGVFHVAVADADGAMLGLQDVVPWQAGSRVFQHVGVISTFVAVGRQGRGVGRRLSRATFQAAQALGYRKLSAAIRADNPRAVAFYLGLGFRLIGAARRQAFIEGRYVDEVLTEKLLDEDGGQAGRFA